MNRIFQFSRPVVFAHRGASMFAPENTLSAFKLAFEQGADAIELDVKLSGEGEVMIIHDQTVDRTTGGKGKVRDLPLAVLRGLDAGGWFSPEFAGERIPTLKELFDTLGNRIFYNIELTNYASIFDDLAQKTAGLVLNMGLEEDVMFSSFSPLSLSQAKRIAPMIPTALIALGGPAGSLSRSRLFTSVSPDFIHPYYTDITPDFIERQHNIGRRINVWTVDSHEDALRFCKMGIDGVITDDPKGVRQVLGIE